MNWIFDQASPLWDQNTVLIRNVDDIFCVTSNQTIFDIFCILSGIHSCIKFSQEIEEHHRLPFFNVLLTREGNILCKHQFTEKEHTPVYIPKWTCSCPLKFKRNLGNCLLHRVYTICSSYIAMHEEFEFITTMLHINGNPLNFIQTQIRTFLDSKHQISDSKSPDKNLRRMIFKLPCIGNVRVGSRCCLKAKTNRYR